MRMGYLLSGVGVINATLKNTTAVAMRGDLDAMLGDGVEDKLSGGQPRCTRVNEVHSKGRT